MATYHVDAHVTYVGVVAVDARSPREARQMAERGPGGWLGPLEAAVHIHTEAADARLEGGDVGVDEMSAWRERQERETA